jgi:endonuclease-3
MTRLERANELARRLPRIYPDAHCELDFSNPLELLVATILSAQCTDKRVNLVTPALFARCRAVSDYAEISQAELEGIIRTTGFFRSKAKSIRGAARDIVVKHGGEIPRTMLELVALPGVGRKTANVVLGNDIGINDGVVVDTHVTRLSRRLRLTSRTDPVKIEADLVRLFPRAVWTHLSHWLIFHGRRRCFARKPDCPGCELRDICPSADRV